MKHKVMTGWLVLAMAGIFFLSGYFSMQNMSITADESNHFEYGKDVLMGTAGRDFFGFALKMPISALNVLPSFIESFDGEVLPSIATSHAALTQARLITLLFATAFALIVYQWTYEMYGAGAGIAALFLYVFSPNILAHSRLVTNDIYAMFFMALSIFLFWRFQIRKRQVSGVAAALAAGMAQISKYTSLTLFPLFIVMALLRKVRKGNLRFSKSDFFWFFFFLFCGWAVISAGFGFQKMFLPIGSFPIRHSWFMGLMDQFPTFRNLPVLLPADYLTGLGLLKYIMASGAGFGPMYLLGRLSSTESGFWGYYLIAFLFKVPLATQILFVLSLSHFLKMRTTFWERELYLVVPFVFLFLLFNSSLGSQVGFRYLLPVMPFVIILSGGYFSNWNAWPVWKRVMSLGLLLWLAVSSLSYYPHYISYFNELVWDRKQSYRILVDSNLEWGQNDFYLKKFLEKHPEVIYEPKKPVSGNIVVSVNCLVGVTCDPRQFAWLRTRFKPVQHIAYGHLLYRVETDEK